MLTNANLRQLANYILQNSAGRAVIVTGDFNALYSEDQAGLLDFAGSTGLTDAGWRSSTAPPRRRSRRTAWSATNANCSTRSSIAVARE